MTSEKKQPKISMLSRWQLSVRLFWQHFPLVYPIFGFFVLMNFIVPANIDSLSNGLSWQWAAFLLGQYCLWFLLEAGWTYMAYTTTIKFLNTPETEKNWTTIGESFGVLKDFFPGVGHFGVAFIITGFLELLFSLLPWAIIGFIGYKLIGIPQHLFSFWLKTLNNSLSEQAQTISQHDYTSQLAKIMTPVEANQLAGWLVLIIIAIVISTMIQISLLYWRCQICRNDENPFKSLWKNLEVTAQHPFSTIGINLFFALQFIILVILMSNSSVMSVIVIPLFMMLLLIKNIYLYLFLEQVNKSKNPINSVGNHVDISV